MARPKQSEKAKRKAMENALARFREDNLLVRFGFVLPDAEASEQNIRERKARIAEQAKALAQK